MALGSCWHVQLCREFGCAPVAQRNAAGSLHGLRVVQGLSRIAHQGDIHGVEFVVIRLQQYKATRNHPVGNTVLQNNWAWEGLGRRSAVPRIALRAQGRGEGVPDAVRMA